MYLGVYFLYCIDKEKVSKLLNIYGQSVYSHQKHMQLVHMTKPKLVAAQVTKKPSFSWIYVQVK